MKEVADQVLRVLQSAGTSGLLLSEMAAKLGIDSETLEKTLQQLISERQILEKTDSNDARYVLRAAMAFETERGTIGDLNGCPCFHCLKISRCGVRQPDSPTSCQNMSEWIDREYARAES